MAKARAIIKRRKAVRNIAKITKTMNMIAASRFKKALDRAVAARPYTDALRRMISELTEAVGQTGGYVHPLMVARPRPTRSTVLVLTSNRGLCGGYNAGILREAATVLRAEQTAGRSVTVDVSGKRGLNFFRFAGQPVRNSYLHFEDKPRFEEVEQLAKSMIDSYLAGETDRVMVVYMKFLSAGRQRPTTVQLLPLTGQVESDTRSVSGRRMTLDGQPQPTISTPTAGSAPQLDYEFSPDPQGLLDELLPQTLKVSLLQGFLDAAVSEQVARMVAMKAATDNARELVKTLTMLCNRARQTQITTELSEIMGGAAAINQ